MRNRKPDAARHVCFARSRSRSAPSTSLCTKTSAIRASAPYCSNSLSAWRPCSAEGPEWPKARSHLAARRGLEGRRFTTRGRSVEGMEHAVRAIETTSSSSSPLMPSTTQPVGAPSVAYLRETNEWILASHTMRSACQRGALRESPGHPLKLPSGNAISEP